MGEDSLPTRNNRTTETTLINLHTSQAQEWLRLSLKSMTLLPYNHIYQDIPSGRKIKARNADLQRLRQISDRNDLPLTLSKQEGLAWTDTVIRPISSSIQTVRVEYLLTLDILKIIKTSNQTLKSTVTPGEEIGMTDLSSPPPQTLDPKMCEERLQAPFHAPSL